MRGLSDWRLGLIVCGALVTAGQSAWGATGVTEEILVTATKRVERLQDVPISIGVVSGETVDQMLITDLRDLQSFVPNLTVQSTFGNWSVKMRGLGSGVTNLAFDSSVSIFNDGMYCGRSRCLETGFLDVDRVEVARGPQGALFGKSTIAGALTVISAKPTDEFEGYVNVGYEWENDGYLTTAMLSGPLTDTIRGRVVAHFEDTDGFVTNSFVGSDEPDTRRWSGRATLEWDVNETLTATLKAEHFDTEIDGNTNQLVGPTGTFVTLSTDPQNEYRLNDKRHLSTGTSNEDYDYSDSNSYLLSIDQELGEHTLTAIAGYWELDYQNWLDVDGVPEGFLNTALSENFDQTSLEMRLLSPVGNTIEYIVGALYYTSDVETRQHSPFGFFPPVAGPIPVGSDRNFERDTDTVSIYGQLTWNITEQLRVITDLRYTEEDQDGLGFSFPVNYPDRQHPVYAPGAFAQPPEYIFRQQRTDDSIDPSIRLQYDVSNDMMVYAAYATGSKPGGLKANDGTLGTQLLAKNSDPAYLQKYIGQPSITAAEMAAGVRFKEGNAIFDFEDEEAQNYEIGAKMLFLDGAAGVNAAVFYMEFDNLQTSSYDGTRFIIRNAASAEIKRRRTGRFLAGHRHPAADRRGGLPRSRVQRVRWLTVSSRRQGRELQGSHLCGWSGRHRWRAHRTYARLGGEPCRRLAASGGRRAHVVRHRVTLLLR
ncbi:MAG: TonB-dependent receptor [Gammaproteobacteria bacterium]|nr:TonB-dependent receptor [Gammaproteobacteria bacterium]